MTPLERKLENARREAHHLRTLVEAEPENAFFKEELAHATDHAAKCERALFAARKRNAAARANRSALRDVCESMGVKMVRGAVSGQIYFE
jgi:hypothetical protein